VRYRIVNPSKTETLGFGQWYVSGNYVDDARDVSKNNWLGIDMPKGATNDDKKEAVMDKPHAAEPMPLQSAEEAYKSILETVGASYRRDTMDVRIINDVKNRTGRFIDVQGGYAHGTEYELTVNAWPALKSLPAPADADKDGMPDEWETKNGLNPQDASDAAAYKLHKQYTNIEVYINGLVKN
jgi:hypothetical protein